MAKYLGEFYILHTAIIQRQRKEILEVTASGPQGQVVVYCHRNIDKYIHLFQKQLEVSIDGDMQIINGKQSIIASRIRIGMNDALEMNIGRLWDMVDTLSSSNHIKLTEAVMSDCSLYNKIISSPASLSGNYDFTGGVLLKTVKSMEMSLHIAQIEPEADVNVLLSGIIMKAVGISHCYSGNGFKFRLTKDAKHFGADNISHRIFLEKASLIDGFSESDIRKMENCILCDGSGYIAPASLEAKLIVRIMDMVEAFEI